MAVSEYRKMFEAEDRYFWFVGKRRLVERLVSSLGLGPEAAILDLGCGTGANLKNLARFGFAAGLDYFAEAFDYCVKRGCRELVLGSQEAVPFRNNSFELVISLDTLEHTESPGQMLAEVERVLKPGGYFLLTVPAYQPLYSRHDRALGHKLRYGKNSLAELVRRPGLEITLTGHFFGLVFPAALLLKLFQKFLGSPTETLPYYLPFPVNQFLSALCRLEVLLYPWLRLPFGTSLVMMGRKHV